MNVRFYFDPLCPWCWITSHWLDKHVVPHRDVSVDWRPISLYVRNEDKELTEAYERRRRRMHRSFCLLRIVEAMRAQGHADEVRAAYEVFGRHFHHAEDGMDFDVAAALAEVGVDPSFAVAYDDEQWDDAIRASTQEAEAVAGDDVGTPIIALEIDGEWKGYFGPVIPEVVTGDDALRLWDGLVALIRTDGFYELKRTRTVGPQVASVDV